MVLGTRMHKPALSRVWGHGHGHWVAPGLRSALPKAPVRLRHTQIPMAQFVLNLTKTRKLREIEAHYRGSQTHHKFRGGRVVNIYGLGGDRRTLKNACFYLVIQKSRNTLSPREVSPTSNHTAAKFRRQGFDTADSQIALAFMRFSS